ncbi:MULTISPECIES: DUF932 domain-containing protein [unclassified Micromonospora]|uniref:DUF932 domain-containing protein n=1 Tax=unclassified Micromonospora TaxID=2617518 RepID=UPI00363026C6
MSALLDSVPLTTRRADLRQLSDILQRQQTHKRDIVANAATLRAEQGRIVIPDVEAMISDSGVTRIDGSYQPTALADAGIGEKLGIPVPYLRKLRTNAVELYDANVNGWLTRSSDRNFLLRCLSDGEGGGIARAFLSDGYRIIENFDVLVAVLRGIKESGMSVQIDADLTERSMVMRVHSEEIKSLAPELLRNYRSPFTGATGADNPTVFAGFVVRNSETGCGAFTLTPRAVVQVCTNGLTFSQDAMRSVHLGVRLDEGVVRWRRDTRQANLDLVTKQARDAVSAFLDVGYVAAKLREIEAKAGHKIDDPNNAIRIVAQQLRFTEDERRQVLNHFIDGGDRSAGGVMQAVTSAAQTQSDGDAAYDMEALGLKALDLAARL